MKPLKLIKSFVKRERPLRAGKQEILDRLWPKYGINSTSKEIKPNENFGREGNLTLEIGFGNGETLYALAKKYPEEDFIGIEVYKPGVANLLSLIDNDPIDNIRIINEDAVTILEKNFPDQSFDKILILFPDPWPKKRHHKRRIIKPTFVDLLAKKIKTGGILNIATDWENYAKHIEDALKNNNHFSKTPISSAQERIIKTKFEKRGQKLGYRIFDMVYAKDLRGQVLKFSLLAKTCNFYTLVKKKKISRLDPLNLC